MQVVVPLVLDHLMLKPYTLMVLRYPLAVAAVLVLLIGGFALLQGIGYAPAVGPQPSAVIAAGAGTQATLADEDLEVLMMRHQALELTQALSDDAGVHMVSYTY